MLYVFVVKDATKNSYFRFFNTLTWKSITYVQIEIETLLHNCVVLLSIVISSLVLLLN